MVDLCQTGLTASQVHVVSYALDLGGVSEVACADGPPNEVQVLVA